MKHLTISLFFSATALVTIAQDLTITKYWDKNGDSTNKENAFKYNIVTYTDITKIIYTDRSYTMNGHLISEISFRDSGKIWQMHGNYIACHENGRLKAKGSYIRNKLNGELSTWHANGQIKRMDKYVLDSLISGRCYTDNGQDTTWFPYNIGINYGNGLQELYNFIGKNIKYPIEARRLEIEGTVYIQFIIDKDGTLSHEKIRRSVSDQIDEEALRVFRTIPARWQPVLVDGEPKRSYAALPIKFSLER